MNNCIDRAFINDTAYKLIERIDNPEIKNGIRLLQREILSLPAAPARAMCDGCRHLPYSDICLQCERFPRFDHYMEVRV